MACRWTELKLASACATRSCLAAAAGLRGSDAVNGSGVSDCHHPRQCGASGWIEAGCATPDFEEDFLGDFLGMGGIDDHAVAEPVDVRCDPLVQVAEGTSVSASNARQHSVQWCEVRVRTDGHIVRCTHSHLRLILPTQRESGGTSAAGRSPLIVRAFRPGVHRRGRGRVVQVHPPPPPASARLRDQRYWPGEMK